MCVRAVCKNCTLSVPFESLIWAKAVASAWSKVFETRIARLLPDDRAVQFRPSLPDLQF